MIECIINSDLRRELSVASAPKFSLNLCRFFPACPGQLPEMDVANLKRVYNINFKWCVEPISFKKKLRCQPEATSIHPSIHTSIIIMSTSLTQSLLCVVMLVACACRHVETQKDVEMRWRNISNHFTRAYRN